jgi:hypothetical protein
MTSGLKRFYLFFLSNLMGKEIIRIEGLRLGKAEEYMKENNAEGEGGELGSFMEEVAFQQSLKK